MTECVKTLFFNAALLFSMTNPCSALTAGPDAFGYSATDSTETGGPAFEFVDISATGTQLIFPVFPSSFQPDDTGLAISLPHGFPFYGETLSQILVSTNGYLSTDLTDAGDDWNNKSTLPSSLFRGGGGRIYPCHDDLILDNFDNQNDPEFIAFPFPDEKLGQAFAESFDSLPDHPFKSDTACTIIQWEGALHVNSIGTGKFTFQAILFADGTIYFSYPSVTTGRIQPSRATFGIQNADATIALQYPATSSAQLVPPHAVAISLAQPTPPPIVITDFQVLNAAAGEVSLSFESKVGVAYLIESSPTLDFENPTASLAIPASEVTTELTTRAVTVSSNADFLRIREVEP